MTDEQQRMVVDNIKLAVKRAWKWKYRMDNPSLFPLKECLSMAYEGLCKAAIGYDESKDIKFSTFVYRCIDNEFYLWFKYQSRQKRGELQEDDSLFRVVATTSRDTVIRLIDTLSAQNDYELSENEITIEQLMNQLNQKEVDYLTMYYLENKTYKQIGDYYGTSYQNAQTKIRNTIKKCKTIMNA